MPDSLFIVDLVPLHPLSCALEFNTKAEGTGVIVKLLISNHGSEVHKRLPTIGKNGDQTRGQIEIISDWHFVLESKPCGIGPLVFGELHRDVSL